MIVVLCKIVKVFVKKKDANPFKVIAFVVMMYLIVSELTHIIFF